MEQKNKERNILLIVTVLSLALIPILVYADITFYDVNTPRDGVERLDGSNNPCGGISCSSKFIGEEITATSSIINQTLSRFVIVLEKATDGQTLTGTVIGGVWDSTVAPTSVNMLQACGSISANTIADGQTEYTFECVAPYDLTANDAVGVFHNSADSGNGLFVSQKITAFDGVNTRATCYDNGDSVSNGDCFLQAGVSTSAEWIDSTTVDIVMDMILDSEDEFCTLPENQNLLRCVLSQQGGALGGNFANNPFDVSSSSSNILIQVGFLDGTDTNPATNGTGYLLLAIALIIANTLLWIGTGGAVFKSTSIFLPALVSLVIVMGFTIASLVDATALILSIVVMVALASPKIVEIISSSRGGGSTA